MFIDKPLVFPLLIVLKTKINFLASWRLGG